MMKWFAGASRRTRKGQDRELDLGAGRRPESLSAITLPSISLEVDPATVTSGKRELRYPCRNFA
jgi:hypothetical protein